jgi:hypothetical protein
MQEIDHKGLEARYLVKKINDEAGKHDNCRYFVLDPQHDDAALQALNHYANTVVYNHPELAEDLYAWIQDIVEGK